MLYAPVAPEVMASPATAEYLSAVARDSPSLGDALAEAIVSHGYAIATLAYAGRYSEVWAYAADLGWSEETTSTVARHALTILLPVAVEVQNAHE